MSNRPATFILKLQGREYDNETFLDLTKASEEEDSVPEEPNDGEDRIFVRFSCFFFTSAGRTR
jgi:hypothetical protein